MRIDAGRCFGCHGFLNMSSCLLQMTDSKYGHGLLSLLRNFIALMIDALSRDA